MTQEILSRRKAFMRRLLESVRVEQSFPLMAELMLEAQAFYRLRTAVHQYLSSCIYECDHAVIGSVESAEFLTLNYETLRRLPNITPNGVILPKREVNLEFNIIHREMARSVSRSGLLPWLGLVHAPINIRLVGGCHDPRLHARPYAATKLHTEIWCAHPNDGVFSIPICGDVVSTMPEFYEPVNPSERFLEAVDDYDKAEAAIFYEKLEKYPITIRTGYMYLYDAFVVHRTVKRGGGPRISIDFPCIYPESAGFLGEKAPDRLNNYFTVARWLEIGTTEMCYEPEAFADATARLAERTQGKSSGRFSYPTETLEVVSLRAPGAILA